MSLWNHAGGKDDDDDDDELNVERMSCIFASALIQTLHFNLTALL